MAFLKISHFIAHFNTYCTFNLWVFIFLLKYLLFLLLIWSRFYKKQEQVICYMLLTTATDNSVNLTCHLALSTITIADSIFLVPLNNNSFWVLIKKFHEKYLLFNMMLFIDKYWYSHIIFWHSSHRLVTGGFYYLTVYFSNTVLLPFCIIMINGDFVIS